MAIRIEKNTDIKHDELLDLLLSNDKIILDMDCQAEINKEKLKIIAKNEDTLTRYINNLLDYLNGKQANINLLLMCCNDLTPK